MRLKLGGEVLFVAFGTLIGGAGNDTFVFAGSKVLSIGLDGGAGRNHIDFSAYTTYNVWTQTAPGVITIQTEFGAFTCTSIQTYQGGRRSSCSATSTWKRGWGR